MKPPSTEHTMLKFVMARTGILPKRDTTGTDQIQRIWYRFRGLRTRKGIGRVYGMPGCMPKMSNIVAWVNQSDTVLCCWISASIAGTRSVRKVRVKAAPSFFSLSQQSHPTLLFETKAEDSSSRGGKGVRDSHCVRCQPLWLVRCNGCTTQLVMRTLCGVAWPDKLPLSGQQCHA